MTGTTEGGLRFHLLEHSFSEVGRRCRGGAGGGAADVEVGVRGSDLRRAGIRAEMYLGSSGMKPQMKYADRRNSPAVVIVGGNEREKGVVTIKDLDAGAAAAPAASGAKK